MKSHQLKALVQVAESGSIRAAARAMNLCQTALTKALRELEEEVGVELLTRSYKGIEFTDAGQTLLTRSRLALSILDKAKAEIALQRGGLGVQVSIAVTPLVGIQVLPQVLLEFERSQPDARINLCEGLLTTLIPQLIDGRLDFAVALADPEDLPFEIAFEALAPVSSAVAGRRNHPLAGAKTWEALKDAKWVLNLSAGSQGTSLLQWLRQQGLDEPRNTIRCDSPLLMLELMQRTDRLSIGPALLFSDPLIGQGIERIDVQPLPAPMMLGVITLRGIPLSRAARQLASMIARHIRNSPPMA
ncbi:MAG: LysR substrate-binding domain-containing protein [Betaproteobacteria bacterium]